MSLTVLLSPSKYRKLLLREKEELMRRMRPLSPDVVKEQSTEIVFEQETEIPYIVLARLLPKDRRRLIEVERTLRKFDDHSFGRCERCSSNISPQRLEVKPTARHCIKCQNELEQDPFYVMQEISSALGNDGDELPLKVSAG